MKQPLQDLYNNLEESKQMVNGQERWSARDLQKILGYSKWQDFENAIDRAKLSYLNTIKRVKMAQDNTSYEFTDAPKVITQGRNIERQVQDYSLSRYACYLIAQNSDPRKEEVSLAQSYFALKTRTMELVEERMGKSVRVETRKKLASTDSILTSEVKSVGMADTNIAIMKSRGDKAYFGGNSTEQMKKKLKVPKSRPLNDFTDTTVMLGKALANSLTIDNIRDKELKTTKKIINKHVDNNQEVRDLIIRQRGKAPEDYPRRDDVKKIEKELKSKSPRPKITKNNKANQAI